MFDVLRCFAGAFATSFTGLQSWPDPFQAHIIHLPPTARGTLETLIDRLKGAVAGRCTIERQLGRGGMGTVDLAQDLKHQRFQQLLRAGV